MLTLRLRQAECAMADGGLEEADRLLEDASLRNHRKGQRLVKRLAKRFGRRAQEHLDADQPRAALADCGRAIALAGPNPAWVALRGEAEAALDRRRAEHRRRDEAARAARHELAQGRVTMAEALLDGADMDGEPRLRGQADAARKAAGPCLDRAQRALKRGDTKQAVEALIEARRWHATDARLEGLTQRTAEAVTDRIRRCFRAGELSAARETLGWAEGLGVSTMEVVSLRSALDLAERASTRLQRGRMGACEAALKRLARTEPKAAWVQEMAAAAGRAAGELDTLRAGPLGGWAAPPRRRTDAKAASPRARHALSPVPPPPSTAFPSRTAAGASTVPDPFLLTVDGAGSYVVFTGAHVSVGPISSSTRPDLPLVTDPATPTVGLRRVDGGYLLQTDRPIEVAGQAVTNRLLCDGDVAALSPRCRMTLTQPHPASGTALLRFTGTRMPRADIRGALLMDRELLLGPTGPAHVVCGGLNGTVALVATDGGVAVRGAPGVRSDQPLLLHRPVDIGGATLTMFPFA
ncbi:MAG: hypothetical protein AAGE65_14195 [Planctomycetota bacterium]